MGLVKEGKKECRKYQYLNELLITIHLWKQRGANNDLTLLVEADLISFNND